jgi:hypothetical protein
MASNTAFQSDVDKINQRAKDKGWDAKTLASKMGDKLDRLNSLNGSLHNMSTLESSEQLYSLNKMAGTDGITKYNKTTNAVVIG